MGKPSFFQISIISLLLINAMSCKKDHNYPISDGMMQYFSYQAGRYWIYKNDSNGFFDSTYVSSYLYSRNNKYQTGITRAMISMIYKSSF